MRVVIGKGGMGAKTLAGSEGVRGGLPERHRRRGAVLRPLHRARGWTSRCCEFGTPEAMWHLDVRDFPAIVTMDSHGNSLHQEVEETSGQKLAVGLGQADDVGTPRLGNVEGGRVRPV